MTDFNDLELEEDTHVYRLGGTVIPGCTRVLQAMGATPNFAFLSENEREFYSSRGHAGHKAVELSVKGSLDRRTLVSEVKPYVIGWERAQNDYGIEVLKLNGSPFVEIPLHHSVFRYGVTPDVVARVPGHGSGTIEVKVTSAHAVATGLQLSAQLLAVKQVIPEIGDMRIGLQLLPEEPYYDLRFYSDKSDQAVWLSMLNTYNWLVKHKMLRERK